MFKGFVLKFDFWLKSLSNSCEKGIKSSCGCNWVTDVFFDSHLDNDGMS